MNMLLNVNTKVETDRVEPPVRWAIQWLIRDIHKVCRPTADAGLPIRLTEAGKPAEGFTVHLRESILEIEAGDVLGFVYGLLHISRELIGVQDFWFWNDQHFVLRDGISVPEQYCYESQPFRVRWRGWFINDEVLLHAWKVDCRKEGPWEMAFETLLRCGGNMVVPGTGRNAAIYAPLAASMGLAITHHHAEPLGAEMFASAYPDLNPSWAEHPELFRRLWQEGIDRQKDWRVVWNLGFRGQGDCPFWENDPGYGTPQARGKLIGDLILLQYELVKENDPQAVCCTNLYGETLELYRQGCLQLPEDVIRIWADNGYGKMVSRRQWNENPRTPSLPESREGLHGIYYHVSFYDLQAASHMTMLPNPPDLVYKELRQALERGADEYWIINCSNVKPHVYYLDFIAELWKKGDVNPASQAKAYFTRYYGSDLTACLHSYFQAAVSYGSHEDEKAGEQFVNHVARVLICQFMRDQRTAADELRWFCDSDSLEVQIRRYQAHCEEGVKNYQKHLRLCQETAMHLETGQSLFADSFLLQAKLLYECYCGASLISRALRLAMEGNWQQAFFQAGKAREHYLAADQAMREREHGKWKDFYANECLADCKQTAWVLESLMALMRCLGDGPHYYAWQREFLYSERERKVMLVMNMENHLKDLELFTLMKARYDD